MMPLLRGLRRYVARRAAWVVPGTFFLLLLLLGGVLHYDYGVSWDEPVDRQNGLVNLKYIGQLLVPQLAQQEHSYAAIPTLHDYPDNDHGPLFELVVAGVSLLAPRSNLVAYYQLRHLLIFLVFWVGCLALYGLAKARYGSWRWGLAAAAALVLSPRLFAEAFYNGKDVVFLALFTLAAYSLLRLLQQPTSKRLPLHTLTTAAAIDVRLPGIILVFITLLLLLLRYYYSPHRKDEASQYRFLRLSAGYVAGTAFFVVVGWPYLWEAPVAHFLAAYHRLSAYPWEGRNLYFGQLISGQVPWHYLPVWIILTTPLPYTIAALLGVVCSARALLRSLANARVPLVRLLDVLFLCWLFAPLLLVIGLRATVYNGWRHLYFVYPALLLLAVQGLRYLLAAARLPGWRRYGAIGALVLGGAELLHTAATMMRLHPYQQVYFSFLPARTAARLFDRDYWGLAYYQGLQWLLAHDASAQVEVSTPAVPAYYNNTLLLPPAERARLRYVPERARARYFITTYRWHPQSYRDSVGQEIYAIRADGLTILAIFEQRKHVR